MTVEAIEAVEPDMTYEIWRRELGSTNVENAFRGVTWATKELAETAADRKRDWAPKEYQDGWDLYNNWDGEKPKLWHYFVVIATTTRSKA